MIITKHVFKECVKKATKFNAIYMSEIDIYKQIKSEVLNLVHHRDSLDTALENLAAYAIVLANLKQE